MMTVSPGLERGDKGHFAADDPAKMSAQRFDDRI
jgi:hypothetical protein